MKTFLFIVLLMLGFNAPALPPMQATIPSCELWNPYSEGTGTIAYDYSGHNAHGTLTKGAGNTLNLPLWTNGIMGGGIYFYGKDVNGVHTNWMYVTNAIPSLNDFTVSVWFKCLGYGGPTNGGGYDRILENSYATGFGLMRFAENANQWNAFVVNSAANNPIKVTITDGVLHHLILIRSGTVGIVYADGGAATTNATVPSTATLPTAMMAGSSIPGLGYNEFIGIVGDVRIFNRVLSTNEMWMLYGGGYGKGTQ